MWRFCLQGWGLGPDDLFPDIFPELRRMGELNLLTCHFPCFYGCIAQGGKNTHTHTGMPPPQIHTDVKYAHFPLIAQVWISLIPSSAVGNASSMSLRCPGRGKARLCGGPNRDVNTTEGWRVRRSGNVFVWVHITLSPRQLHPPLVQEGFTEAR